MLPKRKADKILSYNPLGLFFHHRLFPLTKGERKNIKIDCSATSRRGRKPYTGGLRVDIT
jgi:hypothetical protein